MKDSNAAKIRDLVSCKDEALELVAKRHNIKTSVAKGVKNHWTLRLSGRCNHVSCNGFIKNSKCGKCGLKAYSTEETLAVLTKINPGSPLIRRQCFKCKQTFMYRTSFVLEKIKKFGSFIPASVCHKCKKATGKKEPEKKQTKKKIVRKIVKKRVDPTFYAGDFPHELRHNPFKVLEALKVKKPGNLLGQEN